jgi:tripartite-type tricarboxylate transporter receptor subunit TctC
MYNTMKLFAFILCLFFPSKVMANTIVTKFDPGSQPFIILQGIIKSIKEKTGHNFTVSHIGGARGEAAGQFALTAAKSDNKVIVFNGLSSFTINVLTIPAAKNNLIDFKIISAVGTVDMGVFPSDKHQNLELNSLIKELRNTKTNIFFGTLERSGIQPFVATLFSEITKTPRPKTLNYKTYGEVLLALKNNEIDYSLAPLLTFSGRNPVIVSNGPKKLPEFNFPGFILFKIPAKFADDIPNLNNIFSKTCNDKKLTEQMKSFGYRHICEDGNVVTQIAIKQKDQIKKYINENN